MTLEIRQKTYVTLGVYLNQQCCVHCLLELYVDHMFWFYRENKCDPGWVFDVIDDCSVHCLLKLYAGHMFYFSRENRCDPRCVFEPAVQCTLFIGIVHMFISWNRCDHRCVLKLETHVNLQQ